MTGKNLMRGALAVTAALAFALLNSCGEDYNGPINVTGNTDDEGEPDPNKCVSGYVTDASNGDPLEGVAVSLCIWQGGLPCTVWSDYTDHNGFYQSKFLGPYEGQSLRFSAGEPGYITHHEWIGIEEPFPIIHNVDLEPE